MAPSLCENCHKRPKFGTHKFCGKTCAAQAVAQPPRTKQPQPQAKGVSRSTGHQKSALAPQKAVQLCTHCGQKPKFSSFDYCGKSCAALASAAQTKPPPQVAHAVPTTKQKTTRTPNAPPNHVQSPAPAKIHNGYRNKAPVPQNDSTEEDEGNEEDEDGGISTDLDAYPSNSEPESEDEPSAPGVAASQSARTTSKGRKSGSGAPKTVPGVCAIPGCGQQSHVEKSGVKTPYCSTRHREEAVKLGLEPACIMCQRYPQSTSDYFCSSACRNQSMKKT